MDILSTGPHHSALIHYSSLRGGRERVPRDVDGDGGDRQRLRKEQGGQGVRPEPAARPTVHLRHHGQTGKEEGGSHNSLETLDKDQIKPPE